MGTRGTKMETWTTNVRVGKPGTTMGQGEDQPAMTAIVPPLLRMDTDTQGRESGLTTGTNEQRERRQ